VLEEIQQAETAEEAEMMAALMEADLYEEAEEDFMDDIAEGGVATNADMLLWGPTAAEQADMPDLALFKEMHARRLAHEAGQLYDEDDEEDDYDHEGGQGAGDRPNAEKFDQLLAAEYGNEDIGDLEDDEIEGNVDPEDLEAMLDEYLEEREADKVMLESLNQPQYQTLDDCPRVTEETKAIIERHYEVEDDADAETSEGETEEESSKNWDCETVLSTLSNLSNRPGKINKIKLVKKPATKKELEAVAEGGSDDENGSDNDAVELPDVCTDRPKNETPEEKKARKGAVKEMRRICRQMKKESKDMYKAEAAKLNKVNGTGEVRSKLRCLKL